MKDSLELIIFFIYLFLLNCVCLLCTKGFHLEKGVPIKCGFQQEGGGPIKGGFQQKGFQQWGFQLEWFQLEGVIPIRGRLCHVDGDKLQLEKGYQLEGVIPTRGMSSNWREGVPARGMVFQLEGGFQLEEGVPT